MSILVQIMNHVSMGNAKRTFALPILAVFLFGCATANHPDDSWFARDKAYHFGISAGVSAGIATVALNNGQSDAEAMVYAVAFTMPLGVGKEVYDREIKKTYWSWKDLAWDFAGALAGGAAGVAAH